MSLDFLDEFEAANDVAIAAHGGGTAPGPRRELRELADGLEQRHYDVIGLALIAAAVYLAFVLYMGWDGGRVGAWLATALENAAGRVAYVVPIALAAWGGALIARPSCVRPALNAGGILVLAALLLAFAAETAGLGPERPNRHDFFEQRFMVEHGGAVGEALYWASTTLFQRLGAHILAVLMLVSGTLLLTGTTVAGFLGQPGGRCAEPGRAPATSPARFAPSAGRRPTPGARRPARRSRSRAPTRPSRSPPSSATRPRRSPRGRGRRRRTATESAGTISPPRTPPARDESERGSGRRSPRGGGR